MAEIGQGCSEPAEGFGSKFMKNRGILGYIIKNAQCVEKFSFFVIRWFCRTKMVMLVLLRHICNKIWLWQSSKNRGILQTRKNC